MDAALTVALHKLVQAVTGDPAPVSVARIVSTDFAHRPATISTDRRTLSVLVATNTKAGILYRRSPGHVFADALGVLFDRNMAAIQAWCEWEAAGMQFVAWNSMIWPQLAEDPTLYYRLWPAAAAKPTAKPAAESLHGRPVAVAELDEWTRITPSGIARGDVGEAGGAEQLAGLYWEDGLAAALADGTSSKSPIDPPEHWRLRLPPLQEAFASIADASTFV